MCIDFYIISVWDVTLIISEPGPFHGVQQHHADAFELLLDTYHWQLGARDTMGRLY